MRVYFILVMAMFFAAITDAIFIKNCAASWDMQPTLEMSEDYTDNVDLIPHGLEKSEYITRLSPQLNLAVTGVRTRLDLGYRYERLFYKNDSSKNTGYHQADVKLFRKLYKNWLFIDALGNYNQQVINQGQTENIDNVFVTGNRTDVVSYNVSPYAKFKIGDEIDSELRTSYGEVKYRRNPEFDSEVTSDSITLQRPPQVGPFGWSFRYQTSRIKAKNNQTTELKSGSAETIYRITQHYHVFIGALYEGNKFDQQLIGPSTNGTFIYGGYRWKPNGRARVEMSCGERFFGNSCTATVENRSRFTTLSANYKKEVETAAQRQIAALTQNVSTGEISTVQFLTNEIYITRKWDVTAAYTLYRSDFGIGYYNEDIEFQSDSRKESLEGANVYWARRVSRRTNFNASYTWEKRGFSSTGELSKTGLAEVRLTHSLRRSMTGTAYYQYRKKSSNVESARYQANLLGVSVAIRF